jgi:hypothetical protein
MQVNEVQVKRDAQRDDRCIARANAPSVSESGEVVIALIALCPNGHHAHRIVVQKASAGRRAHVSVTFQANRVSTS